MSADARRARMGGPSLVVTVVSLALACAKAEQLDVSIGGFDSGVPANGGGENTNGGAT